MTFECVGVTGYAGDRTSEAMLCCHDFAEALSRHFGCCSSWLAPLKPP